MTECEGSEDMITVLAGRVAIDAINELGDPFTALLAIMTAASSICLVRISPPQAAMAAFEGAASLALERLADVLGAGEVRQ